MSRNVDEWIRQFHRWVSVVFTVAVIITFVALSQKGVPEWVSYLPLPPLFMLLFTGLYLFAQPYLAKWRSGRRTTVRVGE